MGCEVLKKSFSLEILCIFVSLVARNGLLVAVITNLVAEIRRLVAVFAYLVAVRNKSSYNVQSAVLYFR